MTYRYGWVLLDGWAGLSKTRVEIVGRTPKRFRIRAIKRTRLAGRNRYIEAGAEALVPRHCVVLDRDASVADRNG